MRIRKRISDRSPEGTHLSEARREGNVGLKEIEKEIYVGTSLHKRLYTTSCLRSTEHMSISESSIFDQEIGMLTKSSCRSAITRKLAKKKTARAEVPLGDGGSLADRIASQKQRTMRTGQMLDPLER